MRSSNRPRCVAMWRWKRARSACQTSASVLRGLPWLVTGLEYSEEAVANRCLITARKRLTCSWQGGGTNRGGSSCTRHAGCTLIIGMWYGTLLSCSAQAGTGSRTTCSTLCGSPIALPQLRTCDGTSTIRQPHPLPWHPPRSSTAAGCRGCRTRGARAPHGPSPGRAGRPSRSGWPVQQMQSRMCRKVQAATTGSNPCICGVLSAPSQPLTT